MNEPKDFFFHCSFLSIDLFIFYDLLEDFISKEENHLRPYD